MLKRLGMFILLLVFVAGCGGVRATPFSEKVRPLGVAMEKAVQGKNMAEIDKITNLAASRDDVRKEELAVFQGVQEYAKQDNWEAAASLIAKSNEIQE
jgi:adenylate kinase